jgi:hypothetical protein
MSSRVRGRALLALLLTLSAMVGWPLSNPVQASFKTIPWSGGTWEPRFMNPATKVTRSQAIAEARRFDLIVGLQYTYKPYVAAMHSANPNLVLLVYLGGGFSMNDNGTKYRNSWYSRDASGRKVRLKQFHNYLMNPAKAKWVKNVATRCARYRAQGGYDGCLLDQLGPAPLDRNYVTGLPVNPKTGRVWTRAAWLKATSSLAAAVKRRLGSFIVVANGVLTGADYFNPAGPTSRLLSGTDGGMVELFARAPNAPLTQHRSLEDWKHDVNMLVDAGAKGKRLLVVTKAWAGGSQAQKDACYQYALGTFLLGSDGNSYFRFLPDKDTAAASPYGNINLGRAMSNYRLVGGVYQRRFTRGRVIVNPTTRSLTIALGARLRSLKGSFVRSVTVGPHSAAILTTP